jgi:hypothetical protein
MNWFIESGNHWILCEILSNVFGVAKVRTYDGQIRQGRARKGIYGLLIEAA